MAKAKELIPEGWERNAFAERLLFCADRAPAKQADECRELARQIQGTASAATTRTRRSRVSEETGDGS